METHLYPGDRFFLGGVLLEENFFHQGAGLDDLRVGYAVIDVDPGPPRRQNALVPHHGEVLGHIGFGRHESGHEFGHGFFLGSEGIEDFDALRVGEVLQISACISKIDLSVRMLFMLFFTLILLSCQVINVA
jgi:hypothetical protein